MEIKVYDMQGLQIRLVGVEPTKPNKRGFYLYFTFPGELNAEVNNTLMKDKRLTYVGGFHHGGQTLFWYRTRSEDVVVEYTLRYS